MGRQQRDSDLCGSRCLEKSSLKSVGKRASGAVWTCKQSYYWHPTTTCPGTTPCPAALGRGASGRGVPRAREQREKQVGISARGGIWRQRVNTRQPGRPPFLFPGLGEGEGECLPKAGGLGVGGPAYGTWLETGRTHPVFHRLGCMRSFLLGVIWCEDVDDGHEIDLLLGGTWRGTSQGEKEAERTAASSWVHNLQL